MIILLSKVGHLTLNFSFPQEVGWGGGFLIPILNRLLKPPICLGYIYVLIYMPPFMIKYLLE